MSTLVTITEAEEKSTYSHQHLVYLVKNQKIAGRKSGNAWLIELESLTDYEQKMKELGPHKHDPTRRDLEV